MRREQDRLWFDALERRLALAAMPTAIVSGGGGSLIGQEIPLTVTFDNTSANPPDIGYSPYVDIVMPATGNAPPSPYNGISFKPGSATYNGLSLPTTVVTFDAAGKATHPFAKDNAGKPLVVIGKPGDQLVVTQLPFGSYGPAQPPAAINFTGVVSPLAKPNDPYTITATGGFQYQLDINGNPTVDQATVGVPDSESVQPQLFRIRKTSSAPEGETATGPNFKHTYTVNVDVAPGQTITNLRLSDVLPDNVQYVSLNSVSGNQTTAISIDSTPSTTVPGGTLARTLDRVVGSASDADAQMTFTYFVPRNDKAGAEVIDLDTGGTATAINEATARGTWTSANPNFPDPQVVVSDPAQHTLTAKTTALQKTATDITGSTSVTRVGDTVEYTLNFQVSDFFALDNFAISDILTDGQDFDTSFRPTITYRQKSQTLTGQFAPSNFSAVVQSDYTIKADFDVSSQLAALGLLTGQKLLGAGIPDAGTRNPATLPTANPAGPGTTGTITFRAKIRDEYRGGGDVVQGDVVSDTATSSARVLDYATLLPTGNTVGDGSSAAVVLSSGAMTKSVYAVNGATVTGTPVVKAGDRVTFRLTYNLPFSSIKDYTLTDFLPLPIFEAQNLAFAGGNASAAAPTAGQWKFGPSDTFSQSPINGPRPGTAVANTDPNSLTWNFGSFDDNSNRAATTDILFTVTASNRPFADGLLLTNEGQQREVNTAGVPLTKVGLAQVKMAEPQLKVTKGVVSTNNPSGIFSPTAVAPAGVTFSAPGTPGAAFTGSITSGGLASQPIDATLSNVLGNDLVRFCIIVENTGSGPNGAFDAAIKDTFDTAKLQIPAGGSNLRVTNGAGTSLAYVGTANDFFGSGITLVDASATAGALSPGKTPAGAVINTGRNIAVITYDLQLKPGVLPSDVLRNTATVTSYAATEGGPNFVPGGISDSTTVTVMAPKVEKTFDGTSIPENGVDKAVIGEKAVYTLKVLLPPGTTTDTVVVDSLPPGLAFTEMVGSPVVDQGVTVSNSAWATPAVGPDGRTVTFNLGTVTNSATDRSLRGVTVRYAAVVLNVSSNVNFKTLTNSAKLTWTDHAELPAVTSLPVTVIEPKLKVTKTASTSVAQAGDTATYTIVLAHAPDSRADAHNVAFADVIPAGLTYVPNSLQRTAGLAPTTLVAPGVGGNPADTFTATYNTFALGQTTTFTFQAKLAPTVIAGSALVNVARDTWTSLPGADPGLITPNNPNAYERTGSGSTVLGQLNNYEAEGAATVTVAQPSVTKALVSTSIVNATNSNSQAVIGELATYTVTVKIPQGRTPAAKLVDLMAPGLAYVRTVSAVNGNPAVLTVPGLATIPSLTNPTFPAGGQTITYDLGDIVNTDTNPATDETVTFTIEAVVLNVKSNVGGIQVVNRANLAWQAGASEFVTPTATSDPVTVIEPKVSTTKSVAVGGKGGNIGDPVTYTITIRQDATSPTDAFGVKLDDILPAGIATPSLTSVVDTAGVVTAANFNLAGNTLSTVTPFDLPKETVGRVIQLINGSQQRASTVLNGGGVYTSSFKGTNDATITLLTRPTTPPVRGEFLDVFPAASATCNNPAYISSFIGSTANGTGNGQPGGINQLEPNRPNSLQFDFAIPLTPDDRFLFNDVDAGEKYTITAFSKSAGVYTQVPLTGWTHQSLTGMTRQLPDGRWANWNPTGAGPLTGTLDARTNGDLVDPLDTFTPNRSIDRVVVTMLNVGSGTPGYQFYGLAPAAPSRTITLTVTGTIAPGVTAGQKVTNTDTVSWTSLPGTPGNITPNNDDAFERTGSGSTVDGELNNYNTTGSATFTVNSADLAVVKTVSKSAPNVGDEITFTVTVTNNGPSIANNVEITDSFPVSPELTFLSATASQGSYNSGTGVWTVGTVGVGAANKKTLTLTARVNKPTTVGAVPATLTNSATVTGVDELDPNPGNNTGTATETPQYADLAVTKTASKTQPNVGVPFTYEITLRNNGSARATGVEVTDTLPANVTITGSTVPNGTTFTANVWRVPSIDAGQTLKLVLTAVASQSSVGTNKVQITNSDVYDPVDGNNTDETTVDPQAADLFLTKTVDKPTPNVGDEIEFTIVLENLGPDAAEEIVVTDTFPTGLTFVSASATEGSYSNATGKWTFASGFELLKGANVTLRIKATVAKPSSGPALTQVNTATATTSTTDPNLQNNTDSAEEIPQQADLRVEKIVSDSRPNVGDEITFTITVANLGPNTATNVRVVDTFPSAELEFLNATAPAGTSYDSGTGVWTVGTVTTADFPKLLITARVKAPASPGANPAPATNMAEIPTSGPLKPDQYDPYPSNNSDSVIETPQYADLAVEKVVSDAQPKVGDTIVYTITVTNNGADTATGVSVVDQLPGGLQFISASTNQGTYNAGTGVWTVGTVDHAFARTLSIVAKVLPPLAGSPPPRTNTASIPTSGPLKPAQYDPNPGNNTSEVTITPQYSDLDVVKVVNNDRPGVGDEVTFTITLTNKGADAAADVIITDKLPAGLSFLSANPSQGSYDPVTGSWDVGTVLTGPATYTLQIVALVTYPFRQVNVATVTASDQYDPDPANNTDDAEINKGREWIVVGPDLGCDTGIESRAVRVVDPVTGVEWSRFFPFGSDFRGGVSLATADLLGTGVPVIIVGSGRGRPGEVRVFTQDGVELPAYRTLPYGPGYTLGINVAAGDITGDGISDIVTSQSLGQAQVRGFAVDPKAADPVANNPAFSFAAGPGSGASIAMADIVPGGRQEIVVGSGAGVRAQVRVLDVNGASPRVIKTVLPFNSAFLAGVSVSTGRVNDDLVPDIIVAAGNGGGGGSRIEIWDGDPAANARLAAFAAFADSRKPDAAVFAAGLDTNGDGRIDQLAVVQGAGGVTNEVREFDLTDASLQPGPNPYTATLRRKLTQRAPMRIATLRGN